MAGLSIVLVEPREAGNVGAAARAMKNFGFTDLTIVGEHPSLSPQAGWWASGAEDVVQSARLVGSLHDALRSAHLTVATTSARGRSSPVEMTPAEVADMFDELRADQTLALVFGREDRGLTREETMLCQRAALIPTWREFPTMNLAQAVGVFCYELTRGGQRPEGMRAPTSLGGRERARATADEMARLHDRFEALLLEVGFLHANNPDRIYDDVRAMLGRADLDQREVTILMGMVRQLEWKVRQ